MANQFETSFIPQQPLLKVEGVSHRKEVVNFAAVFAIIIFFVAMVVAGGMYFYRAQVNDRIYQAQRDLAEAEKYFSIEEINKYQKADIRLRAAKTLVNEHTISSVILDFLEETTAVNVGLTSFGATKDATGYHVSLTGQAPGYKGVHFQVEKWRTMGPTIRKVEMGTMGLEEDTGIVTFSVTMDIDPSYVEFSRVLERKGSLYGEAPTPASEMVSEAAEVDIQSTTPTP